MKETHSEMEKAKGEVKDRMWGSFSRIRKTETEDGEMHQTRPHFHVYLILN